MIIFVTGQYAGAQYIHPLLKKWEYRDEQCPPYKLVATGKSIKYWKENEVRYDSVSNKNSLIIKKYLSDINPKLIVLSASGDEELEYLFILEAKKLGIKTANFIDTWTNYKNRYTYNGKDIYPDVVLSINKQCTKEMIKDGIPSDIIQEIGQPYLEEICKKIPPLGKNILLPLQPIALTRGNSLGYNEKDFLHLTLTTLKKIRKVSEIHITAHSNNNLDTLNKDNIKAEEGQGIMDIKNAHTILGMFSMQMIVGYLWGRKVASVQPKLKGEDPSPLSRWNLVPRIVTRQELIHFMNLKIVKDTTPQRDLLIRQLHGSVNRLDNFCTQK